MSQLAPQINSRLFFEAGMKALLVRIFSSSSTDRREVETMDSFDVSAVDCFFKSKFVLTDVLARFFMTSFFCEGFFLLMVKLHY